MKLVQRRTHIHSYQQTVLDYFYFYFLPHAKYNRNYGLDNDFAPYHDIREDFKELQWTVQNLGQVVRVMEGLESRGH